jgi:hypothetical protein
MIAIVQCIKTFERVTHCSIGAEQELVQNSAADFKGIFTVIERFLLFGTIWSTKKYQMIPLT